LKDGLRSLEARPDLVSITECLSAQFAAELLSSAEPPLAVDVRGPREREQKHIVGSLHIPLNHLAEKLDLLPAIVPY
jgi:hydroxyacylglutathione hydrolase